LGGQFCYVAKVVVIHEKIWLQAKHEFFLLCS
jgi:hypothetical protein